VAVTQRSALAGLLGRGVRVFQLLLAILFGAAAGTGTGSAARRSGQFLDAFFTDFSVRGQVGLLDWYTVSVAVFAVVLLAAHGATYLTLKTDGAVHDRSDRTRAGSGPRSSRCWSSSRSSRGWCAPIS